MHRGRCTPASRWFSLTVFPDFPVRSRLGVQQRYQIARIHTDFLRDRSDTRHTSTSKSTLGRREEVRDVLLDQVSRGDLNHVFCDDRVGIAVQIRLVFLLEPAPAKDDPGLHVSLELFGVIRQSGPHFDAGRPRSVLAPRRRCPPHIHLDRDQSQDRDLLVPRLVVEGLNQQALRDVADDPIRGQADPMEVVEGALKILCGIYPAGQFAEAVPQRDLRAKPAA